MMMKLKKSKPLQMFQTQNISGIGIRLGVTRRGNQGYKTPLRFSIRCYGYD